ncbi:MAG: hypothetical protein CMJ83_10830 [Planctomycetes bacterium]|nr:hypothetical protein [Planctomycetota bacterium]
MQQQDAALRRASRSVVRTDERLPVSSFEMDDLLCRCRQRQKEGEKHAPHWHSKALGKEGIAAS